MSFSLSEYTKIYVGWACPRPHLQCSPAPLAGFKGAASRQEGNSRERRKDGERKGEWRREGKGEIGGIAPWLLGG